MTQKELFSEIASAVQIFEDSKRKEKFLFVLGALVSRSISLKKAAEIMEIYPEEFLGKLDSIGIDFSYLSSEDVAIEKTGEIS